MIVVNPDLAAEEAKTTIVLFCIMLDEWQRRLYAGLESLKLGHGGNAHIASLLRMDPHTVAQCRQELISGNFGSDRLREAGDGRLPQEKTPEIIDAIATIMEHDTAGDPISGSKWTK